MSIIFVDRISSTTTWEELEASSDKVRNTLLQEMRGHEADCLSPAKRARYDQYVKDDNYNPVIAAIWADKINRLAFLKSHSKELRPLMMCQEAVALFVADPTEKTFYEVSYPLIDAACWRAMQDAKCSSDPSCIAIASELRQVASDHLDKYLSETLHTDTITLCQKDPVRLLTSMMKKTKEVAQATLVASLSSPAWVQGHGLGAFSQSTPALYSNYEFIRRQMAIDFLATGDKNLSEALAEFLENQDLEGVQLEPPGLAVEVGMIEEVDDAENIQPESPKMIEKESSFFFSCIHGIFALFSELFNKICSFFVN